MNNFLLHCDSWFYICHARGKCFFCSVECGKASWISLKREQLAVLKIKGAICICIEPFKINATVKVHSTWFNMIGFLRYIIRWFCIQSATKLLRLKWSNFEEQNWFPWEMTSGEGVEKFHTDDLSLPMQIRSGKCFWFMAGWSKFPSWCDQFLKSYVYLIQILVVTCYQYGIFLLIPLTSFCGKPMVVSWNVTCFPWAKLPLLR